MADDDYLGTSLSQLERAWREANNALAETIHDAPDRYERGGIGEVVFGSPAWQAYQAVSQSGLPKTVRVAKADGGETLPMRLPYGPRWNEATQAFDSPDLKDVGFYGPLKTHAGDVASEYSTSAPINGKETDYPTIVPGLSEQQIASALMAASLHQRVPKDVGDIAYEHAKARVGANRSPFWEQGRDTYPAWSPEQDWPEPRIGRADGGELPYFAQDPNSIQDALDLAHRNQEPTLRAYEPSMGERAAAAIMGDERPTAWRRQIAEPIGKAIDYFAPPDPYQESGRAVEQFEGGHPINAFETMFGSMPTTGALEGYSRAVTPQGFYSHGAEAAANLPQAKGSYEQMMKMLEKAGVRPEEMRWAGVQEALGHKPTVTQEELHKHFLERMPQLQETVLGYNPEKQRLTDRMQALSKEFSATEVGDPRRQALSDEFNDIDNKLYTLRVNNYGPKFEQYTLPGGENYREVLMHLPKKELPKEELRNYARDWVNSQGSNFDAMSPYDQQRHIRAASEFPDAPRYDKPYTSSHWPGMPNVVAHMRMSDRELPEGGKALHIEELQSDWAKEGQKKGFADTPSAPFVAGGKNDWLDLSLKRALREAAEGGYDKMVWTPGEAQAARYDLSKQLSQVVYNPNTGYFSARDLNGGMVNPGKLVKPEELPDYIGKEGADRLLAQEPNSAGIHVLAGEGLSFGGQGMKSFYDKVVPNQLSKILKKLDPSAKVGQEAIAADKAGWHITPPDQTVSGKWMVKSSDYNSKGMQFDTEEEARAALAGKVERTAVHSIPITPKMREEIMKGLPAYAGGGYVSDEDHIAGALRLAK